MGISSNKGTSEYRNMGIWEYGNINNRLKSTNRNIGILEFSATKEYRNMVISSNRNTQIQNYEHS